MLKIARILKNHVETSNKKNTVSLVINVGLVIIKI